MVTVSLRFAPSKLHTCDISLKIILPCVISEVPSHFVQWNDQNPNLSLRLRLVFAKCFGQALDRLVAVSSIHYCTSTPALSTSSSSRGLTS